VHAAPRRIGGMPLQCEGTAPPTDFSTLFRILDEVLDHVVDRFGRRADDWQFVHILWNLGAHAFKPYWANETDQWLTQHQGFSSISTEKTKGQHFENDIGLSLIEPDVPIRNARH